MYGNAACVGAGKIESKRDIRTQGDGIGAGFGKKFLKLFLEKSSLGSFDELLKSITNYNKLNKRPTVWAFQICSGIKIRFDMRMIIS